MWDWAYLIPIMGIAIPCIAIWTKHRKEVMQMQIEATANSTAEKAAQYSSHIQQLEDRVRVLERIVTDKGYDVATQIEALRDTRAVEQSDSGVRLDFSKRENV